MAPPIRQMTLQTLELSHRIVRPHLQKSEQLIHNQLSGRTRQGSFCITDNSMAARGQEKHDIHFDCIAV